MTGIGCTRDSTQNYYQRGQELSGRVSSTTGGVNNSVYGCQGGYESMPLNGTNTHTDDRYMVWWFETKMVLTTACHVWVFIPRASNPAETSQIATFAVIPNKSSYQTLGTFTVDEAKARGTFAYGGKFPMNGGKLAVKLLDRGKGRASEAAALVQGFR